MHILRVCKRNGYSVSDLDYLFNCLIMSLFTYCITVRGVAAYTKYLSQIDRLLRKAFRFGYIQHQTSIQQVIEDRDVRLWKSIMGTYLTTGLHAVGRIITRSHVLIQRGLRNALYIDVSLILNRLQLRLRQLYLHFIMELVSFNVCLKP